MVLALALLYHVLLIGGLLIASGSLSGAEIAIAIVLIGLGTAALIETEWLIEPRRRRQAGREARG